jgi:hypothetical protein
MKMKRSANMWAFDEMNSLMNSAMNYEDLCIATEIPKVNNMLKPTIIGHKGIGFWPSLKAIREELQRCNQYDWENPELAERQVRELFQDLKPSAPWMAE